MKKNCLIIAALVLTGLLSGCGSGQDAQPDLNGTSIKVVTPFDEEDGKRSNFVEAYKAIEEGTGIVVEDFASSLNEGRKAEILADFENGNEPDVLFYFTGTDADKLIQSGKLVSLATIRKEYPDYASNMKDSMMPVSTADGRQYAVPVNGYWEGLFVNKSVLEACEIAVPGADYTWDQFLVDCQTIKDNGYTPVACSLAEIPHYWFEFTVFNNGNMLNHVSVPLQSDDATAQSWAAGLEDIKTLYDKGFFPENTMTAKDAETALLMIEDKAAFMIDGSWKVGWFQENAKNTDDFVVTYVPAKGERKPTEIIGGLSMGYYITAKAWADPKKKAACVAFIEGMTTDQVVSSFGSLSVTALKNGTSAVENADAFVMSALEMTKGCTGVVAAAQDLLDPAVRKTFFENVKDVAAGQLTPEAAIDQCLPK